MAFTILNGINSLVNGATLSTPQAESIMKEIMSGQAEVPQIAGFLTALRIRGETPDVILGAASIMREFACKIAPACSGRLVDTCGTGGDNAQTFNISTLGAIVASGAGASVAKHGNRSVSSKCGSADLLEGFGVNVDLEPAEVEKMIAEVGIGFMFAPKFHPAMKYAMPIRKSLAMRTIFNILGPLTNPAGATAHVLGVFDAQLVEPITEVMAKLGTEHAYVVHSEPGIDEIVPISKVYIGEVVNDAYNFQTLTPQNFGVSEITMEDVRGGDPETNLQIAADILQNRDHGIKREIVVINAAYAIHAAGIADTLEQATELAVESLNSGAALEKLGKMVANSNGDIDKF